jgi:hypothetical protein
MLAIKEIKAFPTARPIVYNENDTNAWSRETLSITFIMRTLTSNNMRGLYANEDNNVDMSPFARLNTTIKTSLFFFQGCSPNIELKKYKIKKAPAHDESKLIIISYIIHISSFH